MYTSQLSVLAVPGRKVLLIPEILCPMMQAGPKKWQERLISALRHLIISLPDKTAGTWEIGKIIFLIYCLLLASALPVMPPDRHMMLKPSDVVLPPLIQQQTAELFKGTVCSEHL